MAGPGNEARWQGLGMRQADNHSVKWGNGNLGIGFCLTTLEKNPIFVQNCEANSEWKSLRFEGQGNADTERDARIWE